jgi:hypothetical protein
MGSGVWLRELPNDDVGRGEIKEEASKSKIKQDSKVKKG